MSPRLRAIRDRLRLLAAVDREHQVFGAATHRYALARAGEDTALELEARFGTLPEGYLAFVRTLGAAGAGPYYGLLEPAVPEDPHGPLQPDPARGFAPEQPGEHLLDGTLVLADQGCGGRSLLVIRGAHAGEVWSDWTAEGGSLTREAGSFLEWYEAWLDRALVEWVERAAPRIALDGPSEAAELEGVALAFELVERSPQPALVRTLGYLHLREERWHDADAAFVAASRAGTDEPEARLALDRARLALMRGKYGDAIALAQSGLVAPGIWYATRDELLDALERALFGAGRPDEALAVLDERAAHQHFSLALHHRLARERLARNDLAAAGAALERAAQLPSVLGAPQPLELRVPASFDPIITELRAAGRLLDAEALLARKSLILDAN